MKSHPFHIVDVRPWPLTGSIGSLILVSGISSAIHKIDYMLLSIGVVVLLLTVVQWWRDVSREATLQGKHTEKVESGMRWGMMLFILSEVCFFFAFFWAFFHSSLRPSIELGSVWPPRGVVPISPFDVPLLNTIVLLSRGATITWRHISMIDSKWNESNIRLILTVLLGGVFTLLQAMEFNTCSFTLSDSIYGRSFYLLSGFHGLHVLIGTTFIAVICGRHQCNHFSNEHHFGFEARAWYWHFVDVVWLFLFLWVYWWGS